ncbi:hypothetical protein [Skermanella pratensis]|uniref:hypothetical protein n=1 Tax=Skermanella pratensis TaxID=2233999 RepID=UPI0013013DC1|nr:hypothetical protein [Skermanella pratensis]
MGPLFWAGVTVGLILTAGGAAAQGLSILGMTTAQLILCSGLGILFGAFGSTATIRYKGVVIAGVAATSIVLLWFVNSLVRKEFVIVRIDGDVKGAQVELIGDGDRSHYGVGLRNAYEFIVIGRGIQQDRLTLNIILPPEETGGEPRERPFECIAKNEIEPYLGSEKTIQWRFDDTRGQLIADNGQRVIAEVGPCPNNRSPSSDIAMYRLPSLIGQAFAGSPDFQQYIDGLQSPSTIERRQSRKGLADSGPEIVPDVLRRLREQPGSYRTRLGVLVALTEMLRSRKDQRKEISRLLSDEDLRVLAKEAGHDDRTIRIYASEFLLDLGDPRIVPIAFGIIDQVSDDGKYNLILVIEGAVPDLSSAERADTMARLREVRQTVGPKTQALIDRFAS